MKEFFFILSAAWVACVLTGCASLREPRVLVRDCHHLHYDWENCVYIRSLED